MPTDVSTSMLLAMHRPDHLPALDYAQKVQANTCHCHVQESIRFVVPQAARAYDAAAIVIRGPTARTNFTYPLQLLHLKPKRGRVSQLCNL